MILTDEILGLMAKNHITRKDMANMLGITPKTFSIKLDKGVFGSDEIEIMIQRLGIENPAEIFFAPKVTPKVTK
ncbi:hypothetical protein [Anaerovibrio sp. RM50]|uniref:hypothetical protein n=1 Tax=Anaerovibrio sp. RM50 TaxID=1200557 RepID=UPI00048A3E55|nr:hypothetical protein [Anaerovibrio sp. RM50]